LSTGEATEGKPHIGFRLKVASRERRESALSSLASEEGRTKLTFDSGVGISGGKTGGDAGCGTEDEGEV
jgi:hypothetical protein